MILIWTMLLGGYHNKSLHPESLSKPLLIVGLVQAISGLVSFITLTIYFRGNLWKSQQDLEDAKFEYHKKDKRIGSWLDAFGTATGRKILTDAGIDYQKVDPDANPTDKAAVK